MSSRHNGCRVAIIADDLTGALDAAAPFAARGADARVVISLEALEVVMAGWEGAWPAVIAVNTESRHLSASAAAERVARAARWLARAAPAVWFKKIDSTLRGQVVAECLAMRETTGQALMLAPAVPAQGRVVRDAEVWVDGMRLSESAYQADARSAPLSGPLDEAFARAGLTVTRHPRSGASLPHDDAVADAQSDQDLASLYDAVLLAGHARLMAGAAGLATAMAQRCFGRLRATHRALSSVQSVLYVVGSRSPRAAEQLAALREAAPTLETIEVLAGMPADPVGQATLLIPGEPAMHVPTAAHDTATFQASAPAAVAAAEVAGCLARQASSVIQRWPDERESLLFLTGGDIAMAALSRLGVASISVEAEWSPGVALGSLDGNPSKRVMTKAGGFGEPGLLARLHCQLRLEGMR
ncbi:four-carbon acid sugar kinase family protein [Halomonas urumqiensis]|uniref:Four-carbon acid sugar kinase family protein n=1 Tax=Halomonas urumqiensis TaxID=1684789 RepID=A0A2N7UQ58_9GAMM|nr:four-carbon acid sugar kinase family protein [Halomonas urumqiensis]PMR82569.1 hypothetical protein C1H70_01130 [Halomonas urumqiensis]PTB01026.1 hypothetical protein C6V82_17075 [Halomonas urumqiensis]GHE22901.1 Hrp-dependent type III effector protein [Halomonas urumqiensis]